MTTTNQSKQKRRPSPKLFAVKRPLECQPFSAFGDQVNGWTIRDAKGHKLCMLPNSTLFDYERLAYIFAAAPELYEVAEMWDLLMTETDYNRIMRSNGMKTGEFVKWALAKARLDPMKNA